MHENAARALQYYEDLPRRSGRPELRLVDTEPRPRRRVEAEPRSRRADRAAHPPAEQARTADAGPAAPAHPREAPAPRRETPVRRRQPATPRRGLAIPARRRQTVAPRIAGRPDRVAMWAVLLGFFLTGVAAATGHG
jgi:hypothetical protein